jgi:dipeptidyl aminopeptidase/acylaminoacyl peptidase
MLIPRKVLFGNPTKMAPRLSPDGRYLSYIAPDERDVLQVWLRTVGDEDPSTLRQVQDSGQADQVLTADKKRGIRIQVWTFEPDVLVYMQDSDGDENWHLYSVNVRTNVVRDLTPFQGIQAQFIAMSHRVPDELFVGLNLEDRKKHDVYRVNLRNGAVEPDTENPGEIWQWCSDEDLNIRAAVALNPGDGSQQLLVRRNTGAPWQSVLTGTSDEQLGPHSFSADGTTLYYSSNIGAPAERLIARDLATGSETVVAEDPRYDLSGVVVHPTRFHVQAVGIYRDRLAWQIIDPDVERDFEVLAAVHDGDFRIASRDLADRTWLVGYLTDDGPVFYYVYDRETGTTSFLFSHQPELESLPLARMQPISFDARDGLTIHGYLTMPVEAPVDAKLPAVLFVHGGPWGRDMWGYEPHAQWLANRGYAVLQLNYRGSTGYGRDFLNAGNREWGAKMHEDLIDGVHWLIAQGRVDPARVAIMGGSYGGYATLAGLTFTPDVFAAGVDLVGPSNLVTLLISFPPYWTPMQGIWKHRVGDPETEPEFLESRSPLFFADRIRAPLLIGQGANDPRVTQAESEQIVEAMRKLELPVEYVLYEDEGHGFARPENRLHFYAIAEAFLAKHLGGECEPVGDIEGHSGVLK